MAVCFIRSIVMNWLPVPMLAGRSYSRPPQLWVEEQVGNENLLNNKKNQKTISGSEDIEQVSRASRERNVRLSLSCGRQLHFFHSEN